ncbi:MAG TPA: methyltransferase domain-containing protein [Actinomycetota bacterium]|nr:methyltransferase domain-containing protein [Actinomycetota bacterium]
MGDVHDTIRDYWDRDSATYDRSPGHAVTDPVEAAAWRAALRGSLPEPPARVLDAGAGTGALALLGAELGYEVTAIDLSSGMLDRARAKADARGLDLTFVVGSAAEPPDGPFDAVIERHVLWTLPDPLAALSAWRRVTPGGRLVLLEAIFGRQDLVAKAQHRAASMIRSLTGVPDDHHAPYPEEILARLPLSRLPSPEPLVHLVHDAGWRGARIRRLRDVEWARRLQQPWPLGWLEHLPRYALVADA